MKGNNKHQYTVYKSDISYFSGKLEAYLRYKEIPHRLIDCDHTSLQHIAKHTGTAKMPAIEMPDNQWLYDTTPTMQWLEKQHQDGPVLPRDPALRFIALLLEDYGDEWLWRPAMWWRWMPKASRVTLGRRIAGSMISRALAIPLGFYFGLRQLNEWLWDDGMSKSNSCDVRDMLYRELEFLEPLLEQQPYILGSHPSAADFGYFGPMFRHFGNDPISAEVMRRKGPNTYEWLARLWNCKRSKLPNDIEWQWPDADYWQPLLQRIAQDYLPYLHQNALAFAQKRKRFNFEGGSLNFDNTVTTHYRVWCRQELQREFSQLSDQQQQKIQSLFKNAGGLDALHQDGVIDSGIGEDYEMPCKALDINYKPSLRHRIFGQPRN